MNFRNNLIRINSRLLIVVFATLFLSTPVSAASVVWTFNEASLSDGASIDGSFTIDSDSYAITDFNITTGSGGIDFVSVNYDIDDDVAVSCLCNVDEVSFEDGLTGSSLSLFLPSFVEFGIPGVFDIGPEVFISELQFMNSFERAEAFGGTLAGVSSSAVPVPAAAWLFGSGLVGLIGVARRKARA